VMQRLRRTLHMMILFGQISSKIRCHGIMKRSTSHLLPTLNAESTHNSINRPFCCTDVSTAFGNLILEEGLARLWTIYYLKRYCGDFKNLCMFKLLQ
jgi:hypothetical protein